MGNHHLAVVSLASLGAALGGCHLVTRGPACDVCELTAYLTGSFSSAAQAAADPDHYYDIRLRMVPIWEYRDNGPWLYVEQAAADSLDRPYRQRIYQLIPTPEGTIRSVVYELPGDPLLYAGAWIEPARLNAFEPEDLVRRQGCELVLRRKSDGSYVGGTIGKECASRLRGAKYATSEAVIRADEMITWDRGFSATDEQVWGALKGGYVFKKIP